MGNSPKRPTTKTAHGKLHTVSPISN